MTMATCKFCIIAGVSLASAISSLSLSCPDVAPDDKGTCAQRLKWGGCNQSYMFGHCCQTCFNCDPDNTHGCGGAPSPTPPVPTPPAPTPPAPGPAPSASRLTVQGGSLLTPDGKPIRLTGFNWNTWINENEGATQKQVLPGANVARLVGVHWYDGSDCSKISSKDCRTATPPYWKESCFDDIDRHMKWATDAGIWVILTARASCAAGGDTQNNVFTDSAMKDQFITAWKHIVQRYKSYPMIAAYEPLSEPRVGKTTVQPVNAFYKDICTAMQGVDANTPCMVGPTSYYNIFAMNSDTYLQGMKNIIYTFDYFIPQKWYERKDGVDHYPGTYQCSLLKKGWADRACSQDKKGDYDETFNTAWNDDNINNFPVAFRNKYNVPVFLNQWAAPCGITEANGRYAYIGDMAKILKNHNIGWTWWVFRGTKACSGGASSWVYTDGAGQLHIDTKANDAVKNYMSNSDTDAVLV